MTMGKRDRHGRLQRAGIDVRRRPVDGFRVSRAVFHRVVEEARMALPQPVRRYLAEVDVAVREVPPVDGSAVPLADAHAAGRRITAAVVYQRPTEARAADRAELVALVGDALIDAVADALAVDPDELEEG